MSSSTLSVVLSGGSSNISPNQSLGGDPSATPFVSGVLSNLFADITPDESTAGYTDYRCLYFFNDGNATVTNVNLYVKSEIAGGASTMVGIQNTNQIQRIAIDIGVGGGSFTLSFQGVHFTSTFNNDPGTWATNLQNLLNTLVNGSTALLTGCVVTATLNSNFLFFDINFAGNDGSRAQPSLALVSNNLTPSGTNLQLSTLQNGSPINTVAPSIVVPTTPPGGVTFSNPTSDSPIILPYLAPADGFPFWIQRTILPNTTALSLDGVTLTISVEQ